MHNEKDPLPVGEQQRRVLSTVRQREDRERLARQHDQDLGQEAMRVRQDTEWPHGLRSLSPVRREHHRERLIRHDRANLGPQERRQCADAAESQGGRPSSPLPRRHHGHLLQGPTDHCLGHAFAY